MSAAARNRAYRKTAPVYEPVRLPRTRGILKPGRTARAVSLQIKRLLQDTDGGMQFTCIGCSDTTRIRLEGCTPNARTIITHIIDADGTESTPFFLEQINRFDLDGTWRATIACNGCDAIIMAVLTLPMC